MSLQTLSDIEHSIGGRPKKAQQKVRLSVYLSPLEAKQFKIKSEQQGISVSQMIRDLIRLHILQ